MLPKNVLIVLSLRLILVLRDFAKAGKNISLEFHSKSGPVRITYF